MKYAILSTWILLSITPSAFAGPVLNPLLYAGDHLVHYMDRVSDTEDRIRFNNVQIANLEQQAINSYWDNPGDSESSQKLYEEIQRLLLYGAELGSDKFNDQQGVMIEHYKEWKERKVP